MRTNQTNLNKLLPAFFAFIVMGLVDFMDVATGDKLASFLITSQFVKAIISFSGPLIAAFMASFFGDWRLVLAVYGIIHLFNRRS